MFSSEDKAARDSAKVMEGNILYHPEYRDIFVTLLKNHNEVAQSRAYLKDLVEATHVYIRNMETFARGNKHIVVMEKKKTKRGRRKKKDEDDDDDDVSCSTCLFLCVYMCVNVCGCACICVHVCTCLCMCVHVCKCVYMYVHVCMCVHVCACV